MYIVRRTLGMVGAVQDFKAELQACMYSEEDTEFITRSITDHESLYNQLKATRYMYMIYIMWGDTQNVVKGAYAVQWTIAAIKVWPVTAAYGSN